MRSPRQFRAGPSLTYSEELILEWVANRFAVEDRIGSGGMGTVWRGRDTKLKRPVAIKRLHPHLAAEPEAASRFEREARAAAALSHPGVVAVFDAGKDETGPFLVMELVEGETLAELLSRQGQLPPEQAVDIAIEAALALHHAHSRGVVHRDVKPKNFLIDQQGRVKLADFGIARSLDASSRLTATGAFIGTPTYLAPEQVAGEAGTPSSDIYSLGVVLYELLTGEAPFQGDTPIAVAIAHQLFTPSPPSAVAEVPPDLERIVLTALAKEPEDRYPSAADLAEELQRWQGGMPSPVTAEESGPEPNSAATTLHLGRRDRAATKLLPRAELPGRAPGRVLGNTVLGTLGLLAAALLLWALLSGPGSIAAPKGEVARPSTAAAVIPSTSTPAAVIPTASTEPAPTTTTMGPGEPATVEEAIADLRDHIREGVVAGVVSGRAADDLLSTIEDVEEESEDGDLRDARKKLDEVDKKADEQARDGNISSTDFLEGLHRKTELIRELMGSSNGPPGR